MLSLSPLFGNSDSKAETNQNLSDSPLLDSLYKADWSQTQPIIKKKLNFSENKGKAKLINHGENNENTNKLKANKENERKVNGKRVPGSHKEEGGAVKKRKILTELQNIQKK